VINKTPSFSDIKRAHQRISKYITRTPVLKSAFIDELAGCHIHFKCENFQKVGSFKMRGATNVIFGYRPEERAKGFACHSSGNHGQAVAYASKLAGVKSYIVMPENSAKVKINAVKDYGAEVFFCEPNEESREKVCAEVVEKTGAILVHPFDDYNIINGQATAAKELFEEFHDLDAVITPIGGGGLSAGTALFSHYIDPSVEVYLGEPEEVNDTYLSLKEGEIVHNKTTNTIADGLKTTIGVRNFEIIKNHVKEVFLVSEEEITHAMRIVWERMKIVIEPSCAVPLAALLKNKEVFKDKHVGIIITGGNVDLSNLPF